MPKKKLQNRIDILLADLKAVQDESEVEPELASYEAEPDAVPGFATPGEVGVLEQAAHLPSISQPVRRAKKSTKDGKAEKRRSSVTDRAKPAPTPISPVTARAHPPKITPTRPATSFQLSKKMQEKGLLLSSPLTSQGTLSLKRGQPVYTSASEPDKSHPTQADLPAVMAVPFSHPNQQRALLEALDDTPSRNWNDDERRLVEQVTDQLSLALENAYLFQETQAALAEAEALYSINQAATHSLKLEEILQEMLEKVLHSIGLDAGLISIFNEVNSQLQLIVHHNLPQPILEKFQSNGLGDTLCERVYRSNSSIILPDLQQTIPSNFASILHGINFQPLIDNKIISYLGSPILSKGKVLGTLCTFGFSPIDSQALNQSLFIASCQQIGIAIENAQLFANEQERRRIADALRELASVVGSSLELKEITQRMLDQLSNLINFDCASIQLIRGDQREEISRRILAEELSHSTTSLVEGTLAPIQTDELIYEAYLTRVPVLVADTQTDIRWQKANFGRQARSWLCAPLVAGQEVLGFVILEHANPGMYNEESRSLIIAFAAQAAVAIRNARLFEQVQAAFSETDRLYQASAEMNAVESYADVLDILRRTTILGNPEIQFLNICLFDQPWRDNQPPERLLSIAQWKSPTVNYLELNDEKGPLFVQPEAVSIYAEMLNPDQSILLQDLTADSQIPEQARLWYVDRLGMKALIFSPLNIGEQWIGFVEAVLDQPLALTVAAAKPLNALASQAAVAIQNLHLLDETRSRASQLETAAEIARDTSGTLDLDDLLNRAVALIREKYGFYHASIYLLDETGQFAVVRASTNVKNPAVRTKQNWLEVGSTTVVGQVTKTGHPLVVNDVSHSSIPRSSSLQPETRAEIAIPLKIGSRTGIPKKQVNGEKKVSTQPLSRIIGALDVQAIEINAFNPEEIAVLYILADQLAVAVDNARAYELAQQANLESQTRLQELSTLYSVSQALSGATMQSAEIAHTVANEFVTLFSVDRVSVLQHDTEEDKLHVLAVAFPGLDQEGLSSEASVRLTGTPSGSIPLEKYIAVEQVMQTHQPLTVHRGDEIFPAIITVMDVNDPLQVSELVNPLTNTIILVPLSVKGHSIGIIQLEFASNEARFALSPSQTNLAITIANAAAVALENAQLYEEQLDTAEKLRELDKLKSQFLANMSHELRTPLNSIIGFSRVVLKGIDGPISDTQQQDITAIHNAGTHLLKLINDVLDISKIEAGKMELAFDNEVNMAELVESAMSTAIGLTKDKPIQLERFIEPDLPLVRADSTRIRQVLINFLSNAAKFTDQGTITVRVSRQVDTLIGSLPLLPEIIVSVTDTGPGITQADQVKLFRPFSQVDPSPTRKVGGSGLGLSISRLLVELHGGRIGVKSQLGEGSTFFFTLPIQVSEAEAADKIEPTGQVVEQSNMVLIIEDDRQVIKLYERYLGEHGFQVTALMDPMRAVEVARELSPFAITLDIMMPRKDGWQVLKELKDDPETRSIPVVICSIIEDQEKGFSLGAVDYLAKPILEEDLIKALNRLNGDGSLHEVLVIDDDLDDLRLVERVLQQQTEFRVRTAQGGAEGLVAVQTRPPQAIILDLYMPEVDGFTVLEMIRQDQYLRDIPVIIFTAGDLSEADRARLQKFSLDLLYKSEFREEDLLSSLQKVLHRLSPIRPK